MRVTVKPHLLFRVSAFLYLKVVLLDPLDLYPLHFTNVCLFAAIRAAARCGSGPGCRVSSV